MNLLRRVLIFLIAGYLITPVQYALPHDIPRQRVDRTIQLSFQPEKLTVEYTLELDDTAVASDLRRIEGIDQLPSDPDQWLDAYGKRIAPRLAMAFRLEFQDGEQLSNWSVVKIHRSREVHPVYEFLFEIPLIKPGKWLFKDTNFSTSDGLSRLGVSSGSGCQIRSDSEYPESARKSEFTPIWMMDQNELARTRSWSGQVTWKPGLLKSLPPDSISGDLLSPVESESVKTINYSRFTLLGAFLLGLWHTLTPGHGKTLITAMTVSQGRESFMKSKIIAGWVLSHFSVILVLTILSLFLPFKTVAGLSSGLRQVAGFLIAAPAAFRLGSTFRSRNSQLNEKQPVAVPLQVSSAFTTGMTAGLLPCWEAIGLLLLGISAGHSWVALSLVLAFMAGGICLMIIMIFLSQFIRAQISHNDFISYAIYVGFDVLVITTGLQILIRST